VIRPESTGLKGSCPATSVCFDATKIAPTSFEAPGAGSPDGISDEADLMTAARLDIRGSKRMEKSGLTDPRIQDR
jgi:hypothetical protein